MRNERVVNVVLLFCSASNGWHIININYLTIISLVLSRELEILEWITFTSHPIHHS